MSKFSDILADKTCTKVRTRDEKSWHGLKTGHRVWYYGDQKCKVAKLPRISRNLSWRHGFSWLLGPTMGQVTPPLAFVWNEESLRREGRRGLGAADWLGEGGGLGTGFGIPLDWLGGGDRSQYWHGLAWEEVLALDYGGRVGRDGGERGSRGIEGLNQQKCRKVTMEGEMRAGSPNVLHYRITRAW